MHVEVGANSELFCLEVSGTYDKDGRFLRKLIVLMRFFSPQKVINREYIRTVLITFLELFTQCMPWLRKVSNQMPGSFFKALSIYLSILELHTLALKIDTAIGLAGGTVVRMGGSHMANYTVQVLDLVVCETYQTCRYTCPQS